MSTKKLYTVYVADPMGWDQDCPDSEGIFFNVDPARGKYVHPANGGTFPAGHVEIQGYRAAVALRNELNAQTSGDWMTDDGIRHPVYAMAESNTQL